MKTLKRFFVNTWRKDHAVTSKDYSKTTKLVLGSLLGALAAIFQSAGIFVGVGYIFSILTTGPIVIATIISIRIGLMTYVLTILLLAIIQPSELIVFPFTTGLLGISLGIGFRLLKTRMLVTLFAGTFLTLGILLVLFGLQFPILGPSISSNVSLTVLIGTLLFSILYSWIWMKVSISGIKSLNKSIIKKMMVFDK
ncbi:hypothetical protein ACFYKX_25235 [Cytobacillus sp. FJAT-54145]|uniref:Uncharacterized protein n=1 Tax=Cytobacillus spartinae TaxID=3299023 RepID=A0ABW6KKX3_9BACI